MTTVVCASVIQRGTSSRGCSERLVTAPTMIDEQRQEDMDDNNGQLATVNQISARKRSNGGDVKY